jgi:hypothetical protein
VLINALFCVLREQNDVCHECSWYNDDSDANSDVDRDRRQRNDAIDHDGVECDFGSIVLLFCSRSLRTFNVMLPSSCVHDDGHTDDGDDDDDQREFDDAAARHDEQRGQRHVDRRRHLVNVRSQTVKLLT